MMFNLFFNPIGRVPRSEFTLAWVFWCALELGCWCGFMAASLNSTAYKLWFSAAIVASSLSTVSLLLLGMKRLRDAGMPVWPTVVLLVPGISIIALVVMSNMPSRPHRLDVQ